MKRNVLIIEDNKACMKALTELTRKCDTVGAVFCVDNSDDALACAMKHEIDLFLVDIILDGSNANDVSGIQLVDSLRKYSHYEFTPVIFITSLVDQAMTAFHNLHCFDYIEKPFDFEKVEITVDNEKKVIAVKLPEIKITDVNVDITSLDYIFENNKANTSTVSEQAYKKCIEDVKNESSNENAIYELAEQNAHNIIEALISPFVGQLDAEYQLQID